MNAEQSGATGLVQYAAATRTGACREVNEDAFGVFPEQSTFLVVDGCGSASSGEHAAQLTVSCFAEPPAAHPGLPGADPLAAAVLRANQQVIRAAETDPRRRGQGAALCALRVLDGWFAVAHVGDCRAGRYRDGTLGWLTEDHSLAAELRRSGAPPGEIARIAETHGNVVTRAVGLGDELPVDLSYHPSRPGDLLILCSDGLTRQVAHDVVAGVLGQEGPGLEQRCAALLEAAEAAGGHDNATVLLARVTETAP